MSSFLFLNVNEEVREETFSALILDNALMISSAIPSANVSPSGSELKLLKGRTAIDRAPPAAPGVSGLPSGVERCGATRARANSIVVENLSDASFARAFCSAVSTSSDAVEYTERIEGTG